MSSDQPPLARPAAPESAQIYMPHMFPYPYAMPQMYGYHPSQMRMPVPNLPGSPYTGNYPAPPGVPAAAAAVAPTGMPGAPAPYPPYYMPYPGMMVPRYAIPGSPMAASGPVVQNAAVPELPSRPSSFDNLLGEEHKKMLQQAHSHGPASQPPPAFTPMCQTASWHPPPHHGAPQTGPPNAVATAGVSEDEFGEFEGSSQHPPPPPPPPQLVKPRDFSAPLSLSFFGEAEAESQDEPEPPPPISLSHLPGETSSETSASQPLPRAPEKEEEEEEEWGDFAEVHESGGSSMVVVEEEVGLGAVWLGMHGLRTAPPPSAPVPGTQVVVKPSHLPPPLPPSTFVPHFHSPPDPAAEEEWGAFSDAPAPLPQELAVVDFATSAPPPALPVEREPEREPESEPVLVAEAVEDDPFADLLAERGSRGGGGGGVAAPPPPPVEVVEEEDDFGEFVSREEPLPAVQEAEEPAEAPLGGPIPLSLFGEEEAEKGQPHITFPAPDYAKPPPAEERRDLKDLIAAMYGAKKRASPQPESGGEADDFFSGGSAAAGAGLLESTDAASRMSQDADEGGKVGWEGEGEVEEVPWVGESAESSRVGVLLAALSLSALLPPTLHPPTYCEEAEGAVRDGDGDGALPPALFGGAREDAPVGAAAEEEQVQEAVGQLAEEGRVREAWAAQNHLRALAVLPGLRGCYVQALEGAHMERATVIRTDIQNAERGVGTEGEVRGWLQRRGEERRGGGEVVERAEEPKLTVADMAVLLGDARRTAFEAAFPPEGGGGELAAGVRTHTKALYCFRMLSRAEAAVQVAYVDTWVRLATVCWELLEQAAACCQRLAAEGVEDAFVATPRGRDYLSGVGQVYGGLALLIVAAQVYSPWLRTAGAAGEEVWKLCSKGQQAWESSGVEGMVKGVLSSPAVADLDSVGESGEAAGRQVCETVCGERRAPLLCGICLLPVLPFQYPTVEWGGRYYLLPLANLWANRVAADPPAGPPLLL